jgi:2-succinyl-6-hydroxy-2,4-cyclohexadiene-1-carboxylate synthase
MQDWPFHSIGKNTNPPLLFLHGFMGRGADWLPIAGHCADQFYCLLPDLPGHGHNLNLPSSQPLDFELMADGVDRLISQLKLDAVHLVGYSMGGRIALYTALKYPHRIKSLILEGASPGIQADQARHERAALDDQHALRLQTEGMAAFIEAWYNMPLFQSLHHYPQLLHQVKQQRKQNDPDWMAKIISELSPGRQPPLWSQLGALAMPVLLMAGALDQKYSKMAGAMAEQIPKAAVKIIPASGHNVHLERPAEFARLVTTFLSSETA